MFLAILDRNAVLLLLWVTKRSGGLGASPQNKKLLISLKIFSIYLNNYILQFMFLFYSTFSRLRGADFVKVFALRARFAKSASI